MLRMKINEYIAFQHSDDDEWTEVVNLPVTSVAPFFELQKEVASCSKHGIEEETRGDDPRKGGAGQDLWSQPGFRSLGPSTGAGYSITTVVGATP